MLYTPIPVVFLVLLITIEYVSAAADSLEDLPKLLRLLPRYNRNTYPNYNFDTPTEITIQMYIEGMTSFRAQSMDFQLDIYFQQKWLDHRLAHNNTKRLLIKQLKHFNRIWHPDLYFANARTAEFQHVTEPNFLVWVYPNGTVWYDCRISLTVMCMQNLAKYPLDSQRCPLRILSYAYDIEQLSITWSTVNPIEINEDIRMPDMKLREIIPHMQNSSYATGVWACAIVEFFVDREITHHLLQSYLPTALIVVISWFNFWLDVEAVPGRVSLSITTLLTLATQSSAARMALPQASYVKAIDVWMGACMTFVFMAMIEFTVVNFCVRRQRPTKRFARAQYTPTEVHYYSDDENLKKTGTICDYEMQTEPNERREHLRRPTEENRDPVMHRDLDNNGYLVTDPLVPRYLRKYYYQRKYPVDEENRRYAQSIDRLSRIYFPLAFIIFNAIYWTYYLQFASDYI